MATGEAKGEGMRTLRDEMAEAHARDYEQLGRHRDLARGLREAAADLDGERGAATLLEAASILEDDCARIVRRWD